jgi:hypothetical protein
MPDIVNENIYKFPASEELNTAIHNDVLRKQPPIPDYSRETAAAEALEKELRRVLRSKIVVGRVRRPVGHWFARYESDPSTATEVVAETYALAISRLAVLCRSRI